MYAEYVNWTVYIFLEKTDLKRRSIWASVMPLIIQLRHFWKMLQDRDLLDNYEALGAISQPQDKGSITAT